METRSPDNYELSQTLRLPDQVASILIKDMENGVLKRNDMLPTEVELAKKFGVSRSVIREALSQLKYEGLLASHQGKGVTIVGLAGRRFLHFGTMEKMGTSELVQFFELRSILESSAAAKAAKRRTAAELDRLRNCLAGMSQAVDEKTSGSVLDLDFHMGIAEASGNIHLKGLMQFLNDKLLLVIEKARRNSQLKPELPVEVQKEHETIFRAIQAGDPEEARKASLVHLAMAAKRLGLVLPE